MDQNRGSILSLLQWQDISTLGTVGYNRRPASAQRDFIRENIRRVRSSNAKPIATISSSRITGLAKVGTGIIERYFGDTKRDHLQANEMETRNNDIELGQQTKPATSDERTQTETHNNTSVDHGPAESPPMRGGSLSANEKTNQLNKKVAVGGTSAKTSAPTLPLSKVDMPRASPTKDTQIIRRNSNCTRANANSASNSCVLDRRPSNEQSKRSSSFQPRNFGRLPPYLLQRRKEEEKRAAARKMAEERGATPTGYRRVSQKERGDVLRSLKEAHAKTLEELTRVPFHRSTNRARNLRAQLESRLSDIEEMISTFRKPVVFITLN